MKRASSEGSCGSLAAVVPAAGLSRRMRSEKILLPFRRSTVLETILSTLREVGVADVVSVLRPDLPEAAERARRAGARIVWNERSEEDMLLSIRLGLAAVSPEASAVFIWPADHPAISPGTIELLARLADPARVLIPVHRSRRGHPALIGRQLIPAVEEIPLREGLRHLWRSRPEAVAEIAVEDPGVLQNLDTPEAYQEALGSRQQVS
jgi:molybdenum cofactor cytidylyltransferase